LTEFGLLLHDSWQLKRSLAEPISNPIIDQIYDAARTAGALGGKLLGAGGGGFLLLFVRPQEQQKVKEVLKDLVHVPFSFESSGSQIIFYDSYDAVSLQEAPSP
jgi:D-glycero-alpha-D-manno-heptose-7-phosphate kinase